MSRLGVPYEESISKANKLITVTPSMPYTIYRIGHGDAVFPEGGYFVLGDAPRPLSVPHYHDMLKGVVYLVASWIDALPTRTTFIQAWTNDDYLLIDGVTYHASLFEAEVASLTRERTIIYDCLRGERFHP